MVVKIIITVVLLYKQVVIIEKKISPKPIEPTILATVVVLYCVAGVATHPLPHWIYDGQSSPTRSFTWSSSLHRTVDNPPCRSAKARLLIAP